MYQIDNREISNDKPPYIIAEISANHNGNIDNAVKIIEMAKRAGADAVKMQTYTPDTITLNSNKSDFVIETGLWKGKTLYELYSEAFTPWEWHKELFDHANSLGISIFSTPFDFTAIEFLEDLNAPAYKIASFECIDIPLIKAAASTKKPLIISTGMATEAEIHEAVNVATKYGSGDLTLLHCVSGYPALESEYNLRTITDMQTRFGTSVGLSDHTLSNATAIASVPLGVVMVEKHVTLDRNAGGPDDSFSLEEHELQDLCKLTKSAWAALGKVSYERAESEKENLKFRKSLYFVRALKEGDVISEADIRSVRPGFGLAPRYFDSIIGKVVIQNIEKNTPVTFDKVRIV